jgi:hypothetical protein
MFWTGLTILTFATAAHTLFHKKRKFIIGQVNILNYETKSYYDVSNTCFIYPSMSHPMHTTQADTTAVAYSPQ